MIPEHSCPDVEALLARFETEPEHPRHVCRLALQLFDQPGPWAPMGGTDRRLLAYAALLHDIGWSVSGSDGRGHHKASARLVGEHAWSALPVEEVILVAAITRYHRKALPREGHPEFDRVPPGDRDRMMHLSALVRVADALDRRHLQRVNRVSVRSAGDAWVIRAFGTRTLEEEIKAAGKKADLLRTLHPGPIRFEAAPAVDDEPAA